MNDRQITVGFALAVSAWIGTAGALTLVWVLSDDRVGFTAIFLLGVASCLTCREIVVGHRDRLWNAFALGQDVAPSPARPTPLRR